MFFAKKKPSELSEGFYLAEKEGLFIRVRDLFVFGCATGMRYSNYSTVRKKGIIDGFVKVIDKITQSLSYPKWVIKVGIFLMVFVLSIVAYSFYRISQLNELEIRAYEQGKSEMRNHYSNFVKDNPEVEKTYIKWIKKDSLQ